MLFWPLNLLIPGSAVVLVGPPLLGVLLVLLFSAAASFAIWALWIIPENVAPWMTGVALAGAAGAFVAAQLQLAQSLRRRRAARAVETRRRVLEAVQRHVDAAAYLEALAALRPLQPAARSDLLIAFRLAQVLTLARQTPEARAAWRRLRAIDLHHIYRGEIEAYERLLRDAEGDAQGAAEGAAGPSPAAPPAG